MEQDFRTIAEVNVPHLCGTVCGAVFSEHRPVKKCFFTGAIEQVPSLGIPWHQAFQGQLTTQKTLIPVCALALFRGQGLNNHLMIFALVVATTALIGGFVGGEWSDDDRLFSPTGALAGAVSCSLLVFGLGWFADRQDRKQKHKAQPEELRGVFGRKMEDSAGANSGWASPGQSPRPAHQQSPEVSVAVQASVQRKMTQVESARVANYVRAMQILGSTMDATRLEQLARTRLLTQHDPFVAAMKSQREFLDALLNSSRGNPSVMGNHMALSAMGVCELVLDEDVSYEQGREFFEQYLRAYQRVDGVKHAFDGGVFQYDTCLEVAQERRDGKPIS